MAEVDNVFYNPLYTFTANETILNNAWVYVSSYCLTEASKIFDGAVKGDVKEYSTQRIADNIAFGRLCSQANLDYQLSGATEAELKSIYGFADRQAYFAGTYGDTIFCRAVVILFGLPVGILTGL